MFLQRLLFVIVFALCGAVVIAGGAMADTVNLKPAEEKQGVPQQFVEWCAENGAAYPLHCAALHGDVAKMQRLITNGAEIDKVVTFKDGVGLDETILDISPLLFAVGAGQITAVIVLVEAGANVGLRVAGVVNTLAKLGATVAFAPLTTSSTPLHVAAAVGHASVIKILIDAGADVMATTNDNETPLHEAARWGRADAIKTLINAGADVNAVEFDNWNTPLHLAATREDADAVETLLNAGAYHSPVSSDGRTPMHKAASWGKAAAIEALIKAGVSPDITDANKNTPLHVAAGMGHTAAAEMLIKAGADIYAENNFGGTPLSIARLLKKWGVVKLLEKNMQTQDKSAPNVAVAPAPDDSTVAEHVFESAWRSVVYIRTSDGQGSGVIIRPNIVATNCHVANGEGVFVYKAENRRTAQKHYRATIRRADNKNDFCLLDVKGLWGIPANVRRYDTLRVGESVYGLGAPQGLDLSMSTGIISQKRARKGVRYIQTDVAISPGSSGGGLFDREGNLVGIMTAKIVGEEVEGIGFAIPADLALE